MTHVAQLLRKVLIGVIGGLIVSAWQFPTRSQEDASVGSVI